MSEPIDFQVEKILTMLKNSPLTAYYIASKTGIAEQTLLNYRKGKSIPTDANAKLLEYFFADSSVNSGKKVSKTSISGSNILSNNHNSMFDLRSYNSDSPDVLRAQIDLLDERIKEKDAQIKEKDAQIKEKDAQIKEKDAQIKEKDAQINKLLEILSKK